MAYIYHEKRRSPGRLAAILAAGVLAVVLATAGIMGVAGNVGSGLGQSASSSIEQAVLERAIQCYAVEGAYPPSLQYLEDNYGLQVNHDDYFVTYEAFSSNVLPTVQVIEKNKG